MFRKSRQGEGGVRTELSCLGEGQMWAVRNTENFLVSFSKGLLDGNRETVR